MSDPGAYWTSSTSGTVLTSSGGYASGGTIPPGYVYPVQVSGRMMTPPGYVYPAGGVTAGALPSDIRQPLSSGEIAELAKKMTTILPEGETLLVVVDSNWTEHEIGLLKYEIAEDRKKMVIVREPRRMALIQDGLARTEAERISFLARIGVIWEDNPGLTLAEILKTMMDALSVECGDEIIVAALELAWG